MIIKDSKEITIDLKELQGDRRLVIGNDARVRLVGEIRIDYELEVIVGKNSELMMYIIHNNGSLVQKNTAREGAQIRTNIIYAGSGSARITNVLEGDNAEADDLQVFAIKGKNELNVNITLLHTGKNTKGSTLVRGAVADAATARINSMVRIGKNASGADSLSGEHVLLLNPGARAETRPGLEIENSGGSSRHSASVSQPDENKLFYLMARGLQKKDARRLAVEGFFNSVIERICDEGAREKARKAIAKAI